jgi:hypothetical protein
MMALGYASTMGECVAMRNCEPCQFDLTRECHRRVLPILRNFQGAQKSDARMRTRGPWLALVFGCTARSTTTSVDSVATSTVMPSPAAEAASASTVDSSSVTAASAVESGTVACATTRAAREALFDCLWKDFFAARAGRLGRFTAHLTVGLDGGVQFKEGGLRAVTAEPGSCLEAFGRSVLAGADHPGTCAFVVSGPSPFWSFTAESREPHGGQDGKAEGGGRPLQAPQ